MSQFKPYRGVVSEILNKNKPKSILDVPCGDGWLAQLIHYDCEIDGIDLFCSSPNEYRSFKQADLDLGLPNSGVHYDAIVCCEGIEHFGNPDLFFKTAHKNLLPNGMIIITTPNTWYPASKIKFLNRGFFPSFPCLVGKIEYGTHMHIMPWSYPQLYLFLKKNGFYKIKLHEVEEKNLKVFMKKFWDYLNQFTARIN